MPSPTRRSTRGALPITSKLSHHNSSSSSVTSARPERATRAQRTSPSPTRAQNEKPVVDGSDNEEEGGNEVTRCICGSQDYPGPPLTEDHKALSEDSGNFFIQCDKCNVWQHGGCVGIMAEEDSPDNYSCEQCEKRSHQLHTDQKGQRYSLYLPVTRRTMPNHRKPSISKEQDIKLKKERELLTRAGIDWSGSKRRSTMNSRQNYDEEEMLRKAIEESRGEVDVGLRKTKRGRDDVEDTKPQIKRQRTGSESIEGTSTLRTGSPDLDSDDEHPQSKSAIKRARAAAAETLRQREMRERERLREQQREEAAGRRSQRAGRRRVDEEDENGMDTSAIVDSMPPPSQPASPAPVPAEVVPPSSSHKKTAKRTGKNQYTKDREPSPPRSKNGSSTSGDDRKTGSGKASPSSAGAEPALPAPTSVPTIKAKGRSHKGKPPATSTSAPESLSDTPGDKDFLPPVSYWNEQVLWMERESLSWEDEIRERVSRNPLPSARYESYHATFKTWLKLHDGINAYKRRFVPGFLPDGDGTRLAPEDAAAAARGLGIRAPGE